MKIFIYRHSKFYTINYLFNEYGYDLSYYQEKDGTCILRPFNVDVYEGHVELGFFLGYL